MTQHYFIAIKIPEQVANAIIQERDKTNLHETHKILPVAEDLHITLYYLGHIEDSTLERIVHSLHLLEWDSFELKTRGLAHFGNESTPRVVYTALEKSNPLQELQQKVVTLLADFMEVQKKNEFTAHITIAKKWTSNQLLNIKEFALPELAFDVLSLSVFTINTNSSPRYKAVSTVQWRREEKNGPTS